MSFESVAPHAAALVRCCYTRLPAWKNGTKSMALCLLYLLSLRLCRTGRPLMTWRTTSRAPACMRLYVRLCHFATEIAGQ